MVMIFEKNGTPLSVMSKGRMPGGYPEGITSGSLTLI
jgi:hypothetical protein